MMTEIMLPVAALQHNKFNPNVMQPEEFQALKKDMQRVGPKKIDPMLVSLYCDFYPSEDNEENRKKYANNYVIVDGEHRWTGATELGWTEIRCDVQVIDEEEAKGICYRKNKDRGTIDPFKEAELFKSELELLNQKEIADKYLVDPSTVSHRLSLLKLVPEVKKQIEQLPRGTITTSHLEPIATLPEGEQKKIKLKDEWGHQEVKSVRALTEEAKQIKAELDRKEQLKKALETSKFPKCPKCGQEAVFNIYKGLPWVDCASRDYTHQWNIETGKNAYEVEKVVHHKINGEKAEPVRTSVLRCGHTVKELSETFEQRIKDHFPKITKIESCQISGKLEDGAHFNLDFSGGSSTMNISVGVEHEYVQFRAEEKQYRSGEKSKVDTYSPANVEPVREFIELAFQGKLEVPEKKTKQPKNKVEAQAETDLEIPCFDCANDSENGGKCLRTKFVAQEDVGGYTCISKVKLSGEELAKKAVDAELPQTSGQ
jgi:ParB/RepB/Spo0J family partition protein